MMGGDSSIYSGNGVGGRRKPCARREKRQGEPKLPKKSLRALIIFRLGFLFLLSALPTNLEACGPPPIQGLRANGLLWPLMSR